MMKLLSKLYFSYEFLFDELADPMTKHWPLVSKPYLGIALVTLYLMFVLKWGPHWMKDRPAFKLDKIMMVYNLLQVAACLFIFVQGLRYVWGSKYKLICQPVDYSNTEQAYTERKYVYCYFILKVTDFLDTIFFVLRKKFNQISFLHVYHHAGMLLLSWSVITYFPGGHGTMIGMVNLFVHVIMYFYYFLTVATPSVKQSTSFKKFITQIQLVQFMICIVHTSTLIFKTDCDYPRWVTLMVVPHNIFIFILFADFYIKTYIKKPKSEVQTNGADQLQSNSVKNGNFHSGNVLEREKEKSC